MLYPCICKSTQCGNHTCCNEMYSHLGWRSRCWVPIGWHPPRLGPPRHCETSGHPPAQGTSCSPRSPPPRRNLRFSASAAPARSSPRPEVLVSGNIVLCTMRSQLENETNYWIFIKDFKNRFIANRFFPNELTFRITNLNYGVWYTKK